MIECRSEGTIPSAANTPHRTTIGRPVDVVQDSLPLVIKDSLPRETEALTPGAARAQADEDEDEDEDLYGVTPEHRGTRYQLAQVPGVPSQSSHQASTTATTAQGQRTPSNLQTIAAAAALLGDKYKTPAQSSVLATSATRPTSLTLKPQTNTSFTTVPSTAAPESAPPTKMSTAPASAMTALREKHARQSQASSAAASAAATPAPQTQVRTTAALEKARAVNNGSATQPPSSGNVAKTKLRGAMRGGTPDEPQEAQPAKGKGKGKSKSKVVAEAVTKTAAKARAKPAQAQKATKTAAKQTKHVDIQSADSDSPPVKGGRRRKAGAQPAKERSEDEYEVPVSPPETRAKGENDASNQAKNAIGKRNKKPAAVAPSKTQKAISKEFVTSDDDAEDELGHVDGTDDKTKTVADVRKGANQGNRIPLMNDSTEQEKRKPNHSDETQRHLSGTQVDPLVVSDDNNESSTDEEPSPERSAQHGNLAQNTDKSMSVSTKVPHMESSPPLNQLQHQEYDHEVLQRTRDRKSTIIGWDRSGPRNQGTLPEATSAHTARSSMPPGLVDVVDIGKRAQGPSSIATSARTTKSTRAKAPNVANDTGDALAAFGKKRFAQVSTDILVPAPTSPEDTAADAANEDQFEFFEHHDTFETAPAAASPEAEMVVRTTAALPTVPDAAEDVQTYATVPQLKSTQAKTSQLKGGPKRLTEHRTQSQIAMPPPMVQQQKKDTMHTMPQPQAAAQRALQLIGAHRKRSRSSEHVSNGTRKRLKEISDERDLDRNLPSEATKPVATASAGSEQARSKHPKLGQVSRASQRPKHSPTLRKPPGTLTATISRPQVHAQRVAKRDTQLGQASQGSQTVHANGTPVPLDMEVVQKLTVLDTYPQHARMSSDNDSGDHDEEMETMVASHEDFAAPPSCQPQHHSSNPKRIPVAPQADSGVLSTIKLTESQSRSLLEKERSFSKLGDPFEASAEAEDGKRRNDEGISALDAFTDQIGKSRTRTRSVPGLSQQTSGSEDSSEEEFTPDASKRLVQNFDAQVEDLIACTAFVRAESGDEEEDENEDDPDVTLVDEREAAHPTQRLQEPPHAKSYVKPAAKPKTTSKATMQDAPFERLSGDLMSWSRDLKPHQLNLWNEIMKCGRRITECFIEMEESVSYTLTKLHDRKLRMLREDEKYRAQRYDQLKTELRTMKRETEKDLRRRQRTMQEGVTSLHGVRAEHEAQIEQCERENVELEAWLHELS